MRIQQRPAMFGSLPAGNTLKRPTATKGDAIRFSGSSNDQIKLSKTAENVLLTAEKSFLRSLYSGISTYDGTTIWWGKIDPKYSQPEIKKAVEELKDAKLIDRDAVSTFLGIPLWIDVNKNGVEYINREKPPAFKGRGHDPGNETPTDWP